MDCTTPSTRRRRHSKTNIYTQFLGSSRRGSVACDDPSVGHHQRNIRGCNLNIIELRADEPMMLGSVIWNSAVRSRNCQIFLLCFPVHDKTAYQLALDKCKSIKCERDDADYAACFVVTECDERG